MDINYAIYKSYFNGICGDIYDRLVYKTHATDKTMLSL